MLLEVNRREAIARAVQSTRILDVGGSYGPFERATHIIDIVVPTGPIGDVEFVRHDICAKPWPFSDRYFDFSICSQTLEDIRDPVGACQELMRVARSGYIEVPSRLREIFHHKRGYLWRRILGRPLRVGFGHHRWFCEQRGDGLVFTAKTLTSVCSSRFFIKQEEVGRDLTSQEAFIGFFWDLPFPVHERVLVEDGAIERDMIAFKKEALHRLRLGSQTP
jgi:hypothetical protein